MYATLQIFVRPVARAPLGSKVNCSGVMLGGKDDGGWLTRRASADRPDRAARRCRFSQGCGGFHLCPVNLRLRAGTLILVSQRRLSSLALALSSLSW